MARPRGRKPDPPALRAAKGKPVASTMATARARPGTPSAPKWLGKVGRQEWRNVTRRLREMGTLALADRPTIAQYCAAYERHAIAVVDYREAERGSNDRRFALTVIREASMELHWFFAEFGLTPSSRSRIHVAAPAVDDTPGARPSVLSMYAKSKGVS